MIVLVGGEKGGVGKSTIAVNLATMRAMNNGDPILIDSENTQPSATYWAQVRDSKEIQPRFPTIQKSGSNLRKEIQSLSQKYKDVIIDTGGQDTVESRSALLEADVALLPLRPGQFDLWTLARLNALVGEIKVVNEELKALVCISQAPTHYKLNSANAAIEYFNESNFEHIQLAKTVIRMRDVFTKVAKTGQCVHELKIDSKAEDEMEQLYCEVFNDE